MLLPSNDPVNQPPFALHIGWYGNMLSGGTGMQFVADTTTELYETLRPKWDAALRTLVVTGSAR